MITKNQIEARAAFKDNIIFQCVLILAQVSYENFTGMTEQEIERVRSTLRGIICRLAEKVEEL